MTRGSEALTARDATRSAAPAIRGYAYQFDQTILQILRSTGTERVRIEGVEDLDVLDEDASSAVQIKYLASSKYRSPKSLRDPVLEMLRSFASGRAWRYVLHVHFGSGEPPTALTIAQLKEALTINRNSGQTERLYAGFDEQVLQEFVNLLEVRAGHSYEAQRAQVTAELAGALSCAVEDARDLYHALAMTRIQERAIAPAEADRVLTRSEFLAEINVRNIVYARWHKEILKADAYFTALVRRLRIEGFSKPTRHRGVVVALDASNVEQAVQLGESLARDFTGSRRLSNTKPWTLILAGEQGLVRQVKAGLIGADIRINDGYESIDFSADAFLAAPIVNLVGQSAVISKASFGLRVLSANSFSQLQHHSPVVDLLMLAADSVAPIDGVSRNLPVRVSGVDIREIRRAIESAGRI